MYSRKLNIEQSLYQLTPHKINKILLVATWYESFILEKDGRLVEQIYEEFSELKLTEIPHITRASNTQEALNYLDSRNFDLVITMSNLPDIDAFQLAKLIKSKYPNLPVVLLLTDPSYLALISPPVSNSILDGVFFWSGDPALFLAIIKSVEDRKNISHDIKSELVKVILVVDDSIQYYSKFLPVVYTEVMRQTQILSKEGLNYREKLAYIRARPKILLASNYEDAMNIAQMYSNALLGVITDIAYPKEGKLTDNSGLQLVTTLRNCNPDLPVILMSADDRNAQEACKLEISYVNKNSPSYGNDLKNFMVANMGFGDFVFRNPDNGYEIAHVSSMKEFEKILPKIPAESLLYHCSRNHVSTWLMSHGKYEIALALRPKKISDFASPEVIKKFLIDAFTNYRQSRQIGQLVKYTPGDWDSNFIQIGNGSVGGKARGIAFVNYLLATQKLDKSIPNVRLKIPKSIAITVEEFDLFLNVNHLNKDILFYQDDRRIREKFLEAKLSESLQKSLKDFLQEFKQPIAVRPSSLMEDYEYLPFAGISSFILPNNHPELHIRLEQLFQAIKLLYASVFNHTNKGYLGSKIQEVKMGVVIQELVGRSYGQYFYPSFSGMAQSWNNNHFWYTNEKNERCLTENKEGSAQIAMGLGKMIMEECRAVQFCPCQPKSFYEYHSAADFWHTTQTYFYALDQNVSQPNLLDNVAPIAKLEVEQATSQLITQICTAYSLKTQVIQKDINGNGVKVATFEKILNGQIFPICAVLKQLLKVLKDSLAKEVEIEFAVNLQESSDQEHEFYILQIRPLVGEWVHSLTQSEAG